MQKFSFQISSQKLILLTALYFGLVLNMGFGNFIYENLDINNCSTALFLLSLPVFLCVPLIIFFSIIIVPYLAKPLLIAFLFVSAAANYAMFKLGVFIDAEMYQNIIETNTREATDLITGSFIIWFIVTAIIPAIFLIRTKIQYSGILKDIWQRLKQILICLLIIACCAPFTYKEYVSFGRNNREIRKLVNTFNYLYSVNKYYKLQKQATRKFLILDANPHTAPADNAAIKLLVLVVGETARAQNFALYGYNRPTNPELSKQNIITFADTSSCGTATAVSLPCIFSHQERSQFKVNDARHTQNLVDILQSAGNQVFWRENDDGCKGVCDRVAYEDVTQTGGEYCFGRYCQDDALLSGLDDKISNLKQNSVIVLHTMGSHGPTYYKRYPDQYKKFTPACNSADIQNCSQEQIINTYDNTILYTDHIISSVIDILKQHPQYQSSLIYISDHGESLGENGIYLHGLPYRIAPDSQIKIPFLLWMSDTQKRNDNIDEHCLRQNASTLRFSHDNIFHSVLGLMNTVTTLYQPELDIFAPCRH